MMLSTAFHQVCRHTLPISRLAAAAVTRQSPLCCAIGHGVLFEPARYAGHSHWKNIQHTKAAKDAQKQQVAIDVVRRIRNAIRDGGNSNPKLNSQLARVMEEGKAKDVSATTMLDAIKRMEKAKDVKGSLVYVEGKGIGSCSLIVETYTDRPKWTRQLVQHVLKKYGGTIGDSGTAMRSFDLKGVVYVPLSKDSSLSKDAALEAAIDAGAEDVQDGFDDGDKPAYLFLSEPKQLHNVKKALEVKGIATSSARLEYLPHTYTLLDSDSLAQASNMLDELHLLEDVVRVFDNIADASD